jgi:hypothetical protein
VLGRELGTSVEIGVLGVSRFLLVIPLSRKIFCEGTGAGSGKFALVIRSCTCVSSVSSVVEVGLSPLYLL